jgi:hypothetical protein
MSEGEEELMRVIVVVAELVLGLIILAEIGGLLALAAGMEVGAPLPPATSTPAPPTKKTIETGGTTLKIEEWVMIAIASIFGVVVLILILTYLHKKRQKRRVREGEDRIMERAMAMVKLTKKKKKIRGPRVGTNPVEIKFLRNVTDPGGPKIKLLRDLKTGTIYCREDFAGGGWSIKRIGTEKDKRLLLDDKKDKHPFLTMLLKASKKEAEEHQLQVIEAGSAILFHEDGSRYLLDYDQSILQIVPADNPDGEPAGDQVVFYGRTIYLLQNEETDALRVFTKPEKDEEDEEEDEEDEEDDEEDDEEEESERGVRDIITFRGSTYILDWDRNRYVRNGAVIEELDDEDSESDEESDGGNESFFTFMKSKLPGVKAASKGLLRKSKGFLGNTVSLFRNLVSRDDEEDEGDEEDEEDEEGMEKAGRFFDKTLRKRTFGMFYKHTMLEKMRYVYRLQMDLRMLAEEVLDSLVNYTGKNRKRRRLFAGGVYLKKVSYVTPVSDILDIMKTDDIKGEKVPEDAVITFSLTFSHSVARDDRFSHERFRKKDMPALGRHILSALEGEKFEEKLDTLRGATIESVVFTPGNESEGKQTGSEVTYTINVNAPRFKYLLRGVKDLNFYGMEGKRKYIQLSALQAVSGNILGRALSAFKKRHPGVFKLLKDFEDNRRDPHGFQRVRHPLYGDSWPGTTRESLRDLTYESYMRLQRRYSHMPRTPNPFSDPDPSSWPEEPPFNVWPELTPEDFARWKSLKSKSFL